MVFDLVRALGVPLSLEIATHIYLAILTDTGSFHYSSISPRTFDICRETLEAGVDPVLVARNVYDSNNMGRLKLFGAVLSAMQIDATGRIAIVYLDHEMARAAGGTYEDTEGLINLPLTVKEIQAVVFFKQIEGDEYRVSMRSKGDIDIGARRQGVRRRRPQERRRLHRDRRHRRAAEAVRREDRAGDRTAGRESRIRRLAALKSLPICHPDILPWTVCSSSTSRPARRRTTSSRACGALLGERRDRPHRHARSGGERRAAARRSAARRGSRGF